MDKAATKISSPDRALVEEQLRRLLESPGLQHAESLCSLLKYLVEHSLDRPAEHVKEYQIAIDVFGRSEAFDPRIDSTIRVQTSRLRQKLNDYYATSGMHDPLVIDIPRGAYSAVFHRRTPASIPFPTQGFTPAPVDAREGPRRSVWLFVAGAAFGLLTGGVAMALLLVARQPNSAARGDQTEIRNFWSSVLKHSSAPLVIFSNAEFVGRPETGLRYYKPGTDSQADIEDLYTGVGETLAIAGLADLFRSLNREMIVKRSRLLSWDETKDRDLIFAGSPSENLSLRDLPLSQEFVFRPTTANEPRPGDLAIVNTHPRTGEQKFFLGTPTLPLTEDYALVMLQPGLHSGQNVLLLAGTTTMGTQAAAEFVCSNESLALLRAKLGLAAGRPFGPFSAVLRVHVARGVPVESTIAAVHCGR